MTFFQWKQKVGEKVSRNAVRDFVINTLDDSEEAHVPDDVDWLTSAKRRKTWLLEDCKTKSSRLENEGIVLAENERFWEAVKKWDEAIQLTPLNERLYEMKSQALMELNEAFPAVESAEKTVQLKSNWWIGYQTLGRAQLGIGEINLAVTSFSKAMHIWPIDEELQADLHWSIKLLKEKVDIDSKKPLLESDASGDNKPLKFIAEEVQAVREVAPNDLGFKHKMIRCRF